MKNYNRFFGIICAGLLAFATGCEDGDKVFDQVQANVERGAILRTVQVTDDEIPINADGSIAADAQFGVILEEQDQEGGELLAEVEVYVGFRDNTPGGADNDKAEVLAQTIAASEFTPGPFGLPRTEFSITGNEMTSALGLSGDQVEGGDQFTVRFELVLTDGRRYSFADNSGTLTGSFFSSPFLYTANVVCAPSQPTAGDWEFAMQDSYGDGWNGASLTVTIDGEVTTVGLPSGSDATEIVTVPAGAQVISIVYNSGDWDSEVTFQVTSANGNTVLDLGPNPPANIELLNYCPDNL